MAKRLINSPMMSMDIDDSFKEYRPTRAEQLSGYLFRERPLRAAAVCLGLLCLLLLAVIIGLAARCSRGEGNQQISYSAMTQEREKQYHNLTRERDQLQTSYNDLTRERDQLQTSYNDLTRERDQLQTSYNDLTREKDQLQTSNNDLTREKDQLQTSNNNLTRERDQLQTSYNDLTRERDQLQTSYNDLTREKDQLQTSNNDLTRERDQLQTSYNDLTRERDQLQTSNNDLTREKDQLQTSNNNLTKERDQLRETISHCQSKDRDQLQTTCNNVTQERHQLQEEVERLKEKIKELTTQRCLQEWREFDGSCYFPSTDSKTWNESRQDCQSRGADLVIVNSRKEQSFLKGLHDRTWLGLSDWHTEGVWKWVDGSNMTDGFWAPGEPNDSGGEDCAELVRRLDAWNDLPCSEKRDWICEQVIKL
ncbi:CD209 antigen-like isoform X2 [Centroberyx affinis]|uniref:CD209 antigen-like isoform X2 n=1 Tax=Centroberyx affinis TaxID=166261 RepID=UPI003A5C16BF